MDKYLLNIENKNFKRLYWKTDKKKIKEIISTVNEKYLWGIRKKLGRSGFGSDEIRIYLRYSGYQFQVSHKTISDEIHRRGINDYGK